MDRNRFVAVAIAIVGHLVIGMGLVLERPHVAVAPATVIDVQLMPITRARKPFDPLRQAVRKKLASHDDTRQSRPIPTSPSAPAPPTSQKDVRSAGSVSAPPGAPEVDPRLTSFLRATVGCGAASLVHLSASEREACEQRTRRLGSGFATANLGVDPSKRLAFDTAAKRDLLQQPFLALKPHNGCVPRVASTSNLPGHAPQDTTAGVACAVSF